MHPATRRELPWEELWQHRPELIAVAWRRLGDRDAAEDLVSDVLLQTAVDPPEVNRLGAWLTTVVIRRCHDVHRARRREAKVLLRYLPPPPAPPPEEQLCELDAARYARRRSRELPEEQRQALETLLAGGGVNTVAAELGRTPKAAEHVVARMRARMRPWIAAVATLAIIRRRSVRPTGALAVIACGTLVLALGTGSVGSVPKATGHRAASGNVAEAGDAASVAAPYSLHAARRGASRAQLPQASTAQTLLPSRHVRFSHTAVETPRIGTEQHHESFVTSVRKCLERGIVLSTKYIGCRK